jgi:hypothetical protein
MLATPDNIIPLELPPGFLKTKTPLAGKGRYTDGDKCRFVGDMPEKWGGFEKFIDEQLAGVARGMTSWTNADGNSNVGIGTHLKLYAITGDDTLEDITPIRASSTINNNPFAVVEDETEVTVTDTAHGVSDAGEYVTFSGATAVGGITIVGEYVITAVVDANTYTIEHSAPATSTASGGGNAVVAEYQIPPGSSGTAYGLGWSAGTWGSSTWGTPRTSGGIALSFRYWSVREYGNELMASPSGGTLYLWEEATDDRAEPVSGAPSSMRFMFVTGERFIFALGTTSPMTIQWPDVDDPTDWTPSALNTANTRTLQSGGALMGGCPLTDGLNLVWSDTSLYVFQKDTTDFIYDSRLAGTGCGLIGPQAFDRVSGVAYWMSGQQCHMYAQGVQDIPNFEDVRAYVFEDMDPGQISKTWCLHDQKNNQMRWGYCSRGALEPDKYFDVSLDGKYAWTTGTLARTTGCVHRPATAQTLMVDLDGYVQAHDVGKDDNGAIMPFHLTWGQYALTRGEVNVDVTGILPDTERQVGAISYEITTYERENDPVPVDSQTVSMGPSIGSEELRVCGRIFTMTARCSTLGGDVRFGIPRLELGPSGER